MGHSVHFDMNRWYRRTSKQQQTIPRATTSTGSPVDFDSRCGDRTLPQGLATEVDFDALNPPFGERFAASSKKHSVQLDSGPIIL